LAQDREQQIRAEQGETAVLGTAHISNEVPNLGGNALTTAEGDQACIHKGLLPGPRPGICENPGARG